MYDWEDKSKKIPPHFNFPQVWEFLPSGHVFNLRKCSCAFNMTYVIFKPGAKSYTSRKLSLKKTTTLQFSLRFGLRRRRGLCQQAKQQYERGHQRQRDDLPVPRGPRGLQQLHERRAVLDRGRGAARRQHLRHGRQRHHHHRPQEDRLQHDVQPAPHVAL